MCGSRCCPVRTTKPSLGDVGNTAASVAPTLKMGRVLADCVALQSYFVVMDTHTHTLIFSARCFIISCPSCDIVRPPSMET